MDDKVLHIHLPSPMREDAASGRVNIVNRIAAAVAMRGYAVALHGDSPAERARTAGRGLSLLHMQEPDRPSALCLRRAYLYPFWRIERTNERWSFDVARTAFDARGVDAGAARAFARRWRAKVLGDVPVRREGFLFMPLQGRLAEQRSFQAMSPLQMIEATLEADPRPIRATLHPREDYTPRDLATLQALATRHPRFRLVRAEAVAMVASCDMVVTQNSAVAFTGLFAGKPAVLFARSDFHHIAGSVPDVGVAAAFARAGQAAPAELDAYLWWFLKENAINGGAPEAEDQILSRMRAGGWPM